MHHYAFSAPLSIPSPSSPLLRKLLWVGLPLARILDTLGHGSSPSFDTCADIGESVTKWLAEAAGGARDSLAEAAGSSADNATHSVG